MRNLFRFISILIYLKPIPSFIYAATEQERIGHQDSLLPGTMSNRRALFLGDKPGEVLMSSLSIVSALFTIWIFAETRNKKSEKNFDLLVEDLILQLENLNFRMEDVKNSQLQLMCLFNVVLAQTRNKGASRECLQLHQERKKITPSHFGTTVPATS